MMWVNTKASPMTTEQPSLLELPVNVVVYLFIAGGVHMCIVVPSAGGEPQCGTFVYALAAAQLIQVAYMLFAAAYNPHCSHGLYRMAAVSCVKSALWMSAQWSTAANSVELFLLLWWTAVGFDFVPIFLGMFDGLDRCCTCSCGRRRSPAGESYPLGAGEAAECCELGEAARQGCEGELHFLARSLVAQGHAADPACAA